MNTVTLELTPTAFPINNTWTVEQFHQALVASITASSTDSHVITGQIGGSEPVIDEGPWLKDGVTWFAWNGSDYAPTVIKVGNATYQVTLSTETLSADRTQTLQDKDGVIALTGDVYVPRPTFVLTSAAPVVNWFESNSFSMQLTESIAPTMLNSLPGQEIIITLYNPASWVVTWPANIFWSGGGTGPVVTTGGKTSLIFLKNIGGAIYGTFSLDHS